MEAEAGNRRVENTTNHPQRGKFDVCQQVENALILYPDLPSIQVAEQLISSLEVDQLRQVALAPVLKAVRAIRARLKGREQPTLPGFDRLPTFVLDWQKRKRSILNATCWDIECYVRRLGGSYLKRKRNDARLKEAKDLLKKMRAASRKKRGVTVGEVLGLG